MQIVINVDDITKQITYSVFDVTCTTTNNDICNIVISVLGTLIITNSLSRESAESSLALLMDDLVTMVKRHTFPQDILDN